MRFLARKPGRGGQLATRYDDVVKKLDTALEAIFTEEGKRAVLYFLSNNYSLTLAEASAEPAKLEAALTNLLGEIGWQVVRRKIVEQFPIQPASSVAAPTESLPLSDVFGALRVLPFQGGFAL